MYSAIKVLACDDAIHGDLSIRAALPTQGLVSSEATTLRDSLLRGDQVTKQDSSCFSMGLTLYQSA
ncbi:hypothetical protein TSAR_014570 [Trichomalopsis sarcophagae]|uniref:Uncharacterized protein n=1 Tax=Trichomalopsis sarcophagae TaxID=543379 RepID=A0A232ERS5_9HYME|nr:hypothetical protein TSAR_014570 [Trichomalopsis sarcophagae]